MGRTGLYELSAALIAAALSLVACKPEIGDDCTVSTDCSAAGDRLCDTTQPGGYCTIFNCEPGTCPEEAICVAYGSAASTRPECIDRQQTSRFERTFCLRNCEDDDDCRGGYACVDMGKADNPAGARVVERGVVDGRVCAVPFRASRPPDDRQTGVCSGHDGEFELPDAGGARDAADAEPANDAEPTTDTGAGDGPASDAGADGAGASDAPLD